jgi:hypothetical protein
MQTIDREKTRKKIAEVFKDIPEGFSKGYDLFNRLVKVNKPSDNPHQILQLAYSTPEETQQNPVDIEEFILNQLKLDTPHIYQAIFELVSQELPEIDFMNAQNVFMVLLAFKGLEAERRLPKDNWLKPLQNLRST